MSDTRAIKTITILGGGSAGWMTALYAKAIMPEKDIVVIESEEIGILGAGEGTTPDIIRLFDALDVPVSRLIQETSCTIKNGIRFVNWNGGGEDDYFYHGFTSYGQLSPDSYKLDVFISQAPPLYTSAAHFNEHFHESDFTAKMSVESKVPFFIDPEKERRSEDPIDEYINVGSFAVHFDAAKLAAFLKTIGIERGVKRIEGLVESYSEDSTGDIKTLTLKSGEVINTDFIFDCSGFAAFFNKRFKTEWKSYKDYLPTDAAVPFFIPISDDEYIPTTTIVIAMKYGWMWKTALQHRYGCGYVYDSSLITEAQAVEEIEDFLGFEPHYPRKDKGGFKFNAGHYKEPWQRNVISIGLSSGFIEPLEATSLWTVNTALSKVLGNPEIIHSMDPRVSKNFNENFSIMNEQIVDFIYYHFLNDREDTEFWKKFTKENAPEGLKKHLELFETRAPNSDDFVGSIWYLHSWYKVGLGHKNKNLESQIKRSSMYNPALPYLNNNYQMYKEFQDQLLPKLVGHREFLEHLAGRPIKASGDTNE